MEIISTAFKNNQEMPKKYSCDGEGVNPPLEVLGIPDNAKSLALIVFDPDAPGLGYTHWVLYNINSKTREIKENSVPQGCTQGVNSSGRTNFVPACPPSGKHRYIFILYALDIIIDNKELGKAELEKEIAGHVIVKAEFIGLYERR
jgi:Raf kinase inhibitor-like YbhB/YbcL family protein